MKISVIVATYGSTEWKERAERAVVSAQKQVEPLPPEIIQIHLQDATLAQVRNVGAANASGEYLIFLDGDDELAPGYVNEMAAAVRRYRGEGELLYVPAIQYVSPRGQRQRPKFWREIAPHDGNWLVIGTMVSRELFFTVGGFEEWPIYEDWALFARMQKAGARPVKVPDAIYVAHRRDEIHRNHAVGRAEKLVSHDEIRRAIWPELYEESVP